MKTEIDYQQQALDFLKSTGTSFEQKFLRNAKYFPGDKEPRDIYQITLQRKQRIYTFEFGQSINDSGFYYKINKNTYPIDRKRLDMHESKLRFKIRMENHFFDSKLDTIHYPVSPAAYDVLCCLTKYNPGTFEDFCGEYGYNTDSRSAEKTYNAVVNEWQNVAMLFNDNELEQLREIQ